MASESSAQDVPEWYRCDDCHEYGVALWRPRNSARNQLRCTACARAEDEAHRDDRHVPAVPVSLTRREAFYSSKDSQTHASVMYRWWTRLPQHRPNRLLEIIPDPRGLELVRETLSDVNDCYEWPSNRLPYIEALEAAIARDLAPAEWYDRVLRWEDELKIRRREYQGSGAQTRLPNVIDPLSLKAILLNAKKVVTAERILLDHIDSADYLGVRSWSDMASDSFSDSCRPSQDPADGYCKLVDTPYSSSAWLDSIASLSGNIRDIYYSFVIHIAKVMLADDVDGNPAPEWCVEIAKLGLAICPCAPMLGRESREFSWALVARHGRGFPWPRAPKEQHRGSWAKVAP